MTGLQLRAKALQERADKPLGPGYWCISEEAWAAFQSEGLDASTYHTGALPTLLGRPLMRVPDPDPDHLHYAPADER